MKYCLWILFSFLFATTAKSQEKPLSYQFEIGTLVSVGPNHYRNDSVQINNINSVIYADRLRYEHPSLRLRVSLLYTIINVFSTGLEVGGNIRMNESFYNNEVLFSIPVQAKFLYSFARFKRNCNFALDGTIGYHFRNYYKKPTTEQGGMIFSTSLVLQNNSKKNLNWYTKFGFERQTENIRRTIFAREPGQVNQDYPFKVYRNQLLISLGVTLN